MQSKLLTCSLLGAFTVSLAASVAAAAAESQPARNVAFARLLDEGERPLTGAIIHPTGVATESTVSWGATPPGFPEQLLPDTNGTIVLTRKAPFTRVRVRLEVPQVGWGELWLDAGDFSTTVHFGPFEMAMPPQPTMPRPGMPPTPGPGRLPSFPPPPAPGTPGFGAPRSPFGAQAGWTNGPARPGASSRRGSAEWPPITVKLCPYPPGQANPMERADVRRLKLGGQVRTRTGEPLPSGLLVQVRSGLEREQVSPDSEGRFAFNGLPEGEVTISVTPGLSITQTAGQTQWAGWRLTAANRSRTGSPPNYELTGLLRQDKEDLLLVIEQAQVPFGAVGSPWPAPGPRDRTLYGAESSGPPFLVLNGQVVDDRTGQPVKGLKLSPCRLQMPPVTRPAPKSPLKQMVDAFTPKADTKPGRVVPEDADVEVSSNGTFRVAFLPLANHPMLRAEAPGYVPLETEAFAQSTSNLVLRLKAGAGPSGIVLGFDGQPAVGVTIVLATGKHMVDVQDYKVPYHIAGETVHLSGPDGRFAFEPMPEPGSVFALTPTGYAEEAVGVAGDVVKLRLKPWGALTGTLITTNGTPAAGMELVVAWLDKTGDGATRIQELGRTTTDTNGGFAFYKLPARRLALQHVKSRQIGPVRTTINPYQPYTVVVPEPGLTNNLGKVEADPSPSALDQLKQKLGL